MEDFLEGSSQAVYKPVHFCARFSLLLICVYKKIYRGRNLIHTFIFYHEGHMYPKVTLRIWRHQILKLFDTNNAKFHS